jgi:multimeric flavodoxin WrbA
MLAITYKKITKINGSPMGSTKKLLKKIIKKIKNNKTLCKYFQTL